MASEKTVSTRFPVQLPPVSLGEKHPSSIGTLCSMLSTFKEGLTGRLTMLVYAQRLI